MNHHSPELSPQRIRRLALGDMLQRSARRFGARTALIDGDRQLSYQALNDAANRLAHHLLGLGLAPQDRVGMLCANSIEMVVAIFGIHKAGLTWVPINHSLTADAIDYIAGHCEIRHMVMDAAFHAKPELRAMLAARGVEALLTVPPGQAPAAGVPTLAQVVAAGPGEPPAVEIAPGQLALIMYTSGTTGKQKGVMHSHESVLSALGSNAVESGFRVGQEVCSGLLPLFHIGGYSNLLTALYTGGATVLQRGFDAGALLDAIERHRITVVVGLPMMYAAMYEHPSRPARDLSSLRMCRYAMAPMPRTLLLKLLDGFCPDFTLASGQTEVFPSATIFETHQQRQRFGAYWGVGTLVNDVAVMAEDGRLLGPGEVGEIVFRGPNVMLGYYKDPEATAAVQRFGWHHTGDLGTWDGDGQLLFLDRLKDMIKSGGENVPSIKVEEVLLRHPAVLNAAVVGLPHVRWGEAITAFVILRPGAEAAKDDLVAHCKAHLAGFETPKDVVVLESMPMTSTGKLQKVELRRLYQDHYP
ncbi:MAG: AMP-binding protein [Acidovorax sp.]